MKSFSPVFPDSLVLLTKPDSTWQKYQFEINSLSFSEDKHEYTSVKKKKSNLNNVILERRLGRKKPWKEGLGNVSCGNSCTVRKRCVGMVVEP